MTPYEYEPNGALQRAVQRADRFMWNLGGMFIVLCNICLFLMFLLTALTFLARPFNLSAYWVWPWTMVLFIWLSFFGFFAMFVRLKDVRMDLVAEKMGPRGMAFTRILTNLVALAICGVLLAEFPRVMATSRGFMDGAMLPTGHELPRQALSVPLFVSAALISISTFVDFAKILVGLPENVSIHHPEA